MIGFTRNEAGVDALVQEGPETRGLSKQGLYNLLAEQWLLPSSESKGVCRPWLIQVHRGEVFRVPLLAYKRFEADLTPQHFKRNSLTSLGYLVIRLNALLNIRGHRQLGFPQFCVPEETWVVKVARFADPHNILEFFTRCVQPLQAVGFDHDMVDRIHVARTLLHRTVLVQPGYMQQSSVFEALVKISELQRKVLAKEFEVEETVTKERAARAELTSVEAAKRDAIVKASTLIYGIENPDFRPDRLLTNGEALDVRDANRLQTIALS